MDIYDLLPSKTKPGVLSVPSTIWSFIFVISIGFLSPTTALASSHVSPAPIVGISRTVDFAQVSVVRLVATYSQAAKPPSTSLVQCTGLGVMISSWVSESGTDQNNWILTDGSLVNPAQPSCVSIASNSNLTLLRVDLYFNKAFNPALVSPFPVSPISVHCLTPGCSGAPALLSFATASNQTFPHVDLATSNLTQNMALGLHLQNASGPITSLPAPFNTSEQVSDQYIKEALRYLTPQQTMPADPKNPLEAGTPIFNQAGELTALVLSNKTALPVSDLAALISTLPDFKLPSTPTSASPHTNPVYKSWKTGITSYYQGDLPTARTAFHNAATGNALFETPIAFEQLIANRLNKNGGSPQGSSSSITVTFFGIQLALSDKMLLIIFILAVLAVLLVFVVALLTRTRLVRRKRILEEYAEAERRAKQETQRITTLEEAQNQNDRQWASQKRTVFPESAISKQQLVTNERIQIPILPTQSPPVKEPPAPSLLPTVDFDPPRVLDDPVRGKAQRAANIGAATHIGQRLGNYRIKSLLGHGGFADVYLGEHVFLKTNAAIKVLHTRLTSSDLTRFLAEARTVVNLSHPHIVRVLEFGVEGNEPDLDQSSFNLESSIPFLIMDYASGGTLRGRYPKGTCVPLPQVVYYVNHVAAALQYAHTRKLIHRDVKPENMLLNQHGELLLSDFGIVTVAHSEHSMSTQEMAGTISYMAPEQIKGKPQPASDQYSLAVVVYEWLSGVRPFQGNSQWEIINQHLSLSPIPLWERQRTLPRAVNEVVLKALSKVPSQRFENIIAFADALEQTAR